MKGRLKKIFLIVILGVLAISLLVALSISIFYMTYFIGLGHSIPSIIGLDGRPIPSLRNPGGPLTAEKEAMLEKRLPEICGRLNKIRRADKQLDPANWKFKKVWPGGAILCSVKGQGKSEVNIIIWSENGELIGYNPHKEDTIPFTSPTEIMEQFFKTVRPVPPNSRLEKTIKTEKITLYLWARFNKDDVRYRGDDVRFLFDADGNWIDYDSGPGYPPCDGEPVLTPDDAFMIATHAVMEMAKEYPNPGYLKPTEIKLQIADPVDLYRSRGFGVVGRRSKEFDKPRLVYSASIDYQIPYQSIILDEKSHILVDAVTGEVVYNLTSWPARHLCLAW